MTRQEANILIAKSLLEFCERPTSSDLRFGQILANLHIIEYSHDIFEGAVIPKDPFNEESVQTLKRIKESNK